MNKQKHSLLKILMVLMLLFFYLPIGFMIVFSFNSSKSLTHFTGFSMQWYSKMLADASMMESLYVTIIVAIIATVVSTIVGTISAIGLSKSKKIVHDLIPLILKKVLQHYYWHISHFAFLMLYYLLCLKFAL